VAEGLTEAVQTPLEDNTGGSALGIVDALTGSKSDPVKPGMTHQQAMQAAFLPNAGAGFLMAGALQGFGAAIGSIHAQRVTGEKARQRQTLETAGLTQSNPETGQSAFTPEATAKPAPEAEAAAAAVAPPEAATQAPSAETTAKPKNWAEADAEAKKRLGIEDKPAAESTATEQAPEDPFNVEHDPNLPEADVGLDILERLDDDELPIALQSDDPIGAAADLIGGRPELDPEAGVPPELVRADANVMATPASSWRSQWQALPTSELQLMAMKSPEVQRRLLALTGQTPETATKGQLIDALDALAGDGALYIPSRMNPTETIIPVSEISVNPARFQFKQGVDAQGQQKGNSLSGVDKWSTDAEGAIQVWNDSADGKTYVVNGHNRVAKAKELGIPSLPARELLAGDHVEARAAGALSNIFSGGGTVFDSAKFFRDSGVTDLEVLRGMGMPVDSGTGPGGAALAQLPDNIFQDAIDGKISQNKAIALGASGLDPDSMQQAYKALQGREMSYETWLEVLQQAKSSPVTTGQQVDLFGNTETLNLMVQKGDLARRIRAEISGDKKLFGSVKRNAGKLEAGGNQIDAAASGDIAAKAQALLTSFDAEKYAAGTAISDLLNRGAEEVANGAKPAVVARRIKQELVQSLDQVQVPEVSAQAVDTPELPAEPPVLTEEQRQAMQLAGVQKAIANGKVRPPETPIPDVPALDVNLEKALKDLEAGDLSDDVVRLMDEELRLRDHFSEAQAKAEAAHVQEVRDEIGYQNMTYDQKKSLGITDGFDTRGSDVITPEVLPAKSKTPIADMLGEQLRKMAESDARVYREIDGLTKLTRKAIDELSEGASAKKPELPPDALASSGWDSIDPGNGDELVGGYQPLPDWDQLTPFQQSRFAEVTQLTADLKAEISRIAGHDVQVHVDMRRYVANQTAKEWGGAPRPTEKLGWYSPVEDTITINAALFRPTSTLLQTAYHESFHRMQYALLNAKEIAVLDSRAGMMKTLFGTARYVPEGNKWALVEHQAVAFQKHAYARSIGADPIQYMIGVNKSSPAIAKALGQVVSVFNKLWNVLERVNNWAKGRGFQSVEDIYNRAFLGKYGEVEPDFALEQITASQVFRAETVDAWRHRMFSMDVDLQQVNAEMDQVRTAAMKGGC